MSEIKQPSFPVPFLYSVLVSISVCTVLLTAFHFINSPDSSPFSDSILSVVFPPYWPFQLYISFGKSPDITAVGGPGSKHVNSLTN